jgi:hypothetical protein
MSLVVVPMDIPRIWVCTAPATPTVQRSEFDMFIVGVIADGGGDFNVVVEVLLISLVVVLSVTIVSVFVVSSCACKEPDNTSAKISNNLFM